jgi:hypothetical protein
MFLVFRYDSSEEKDGDIRRYMGKYSSLIEAREAIVLYTKNGYFHERDFYTVSM